MAVGDERMTVTVVFPDRTGEEPVDVPAGAAAGFALAAAIRRHPLPELADGEAWALFRGGTQLREHDPLVADETLELRAVAP